ncbi:ABC transporter substrate-binding protein [Nocardia aurantiaca]|uniref:Transporter substrate-binding domain-containing protein n=1 Tax=Nocardia aurantiaca TaxID=2675850 RepID=A0A6I3KXD1_9NOCA|nr:ABC transporter substrate-binding protein [Nocardia aurantiaca]MTE12139.1 transporter substrate-binding domain-containing protein [Nocardia aurantiaca]
MSLASRRRRITALIALTVLGLFASACGGAGDGGVRSSDTVNGLSYDLSPQQPGRVHATKVDAIAAQLPTAVRDRGTLVVTGSVGATPPLRFYATDDRTPIGSDTDISYLIADILGLKVDTRIGDWAQNFVKIDSGEADVFISNATVTEERKEKYDFATYRLDNIALEVPKDATWTYKDRKSLAGRKIGVGSGTNQEQLLVKWNEDNLAEGLPKIDLVYYEKAGDYYLALSSGRLDGYLGPNPAARYHAAASGQTKVVTTLSGAGDALQAEIGVLTKKDNGLAGPLRAALQYAIDNGLYKQVLDRWGLGDEAVPQSRINPPGLPKKKG